MASSLRRPRSLVVEIEQQHSGKVKILKVPSGVSVKLTEKALQNASQPGPEYIVGPMDHKRRKAR